ncbi:EscU/YscU/HrcU family type III secretion system export apparatus switch protein [Undibacterium flavidum]|uniref:EscU/YscU/HrcU family type III secretion system export apparatus switch protein n=1 Tax=Undibacterium flavidum TaxID=2762297 RepID=A0ABR6Y6Q1_9BURK|nr:EscU/YscU/HrcU family type III secretion system export apparatus switch protein [Undibacterium flavidum]MBC3872296.1 EscU/YscU/HrcU family type III secretion system export apparatus switch protein [Undibacterium flavidum]
MKNSDQPVNSAVALSYRQEDKAPKVVAKGKGLIADEIIARANEHGVFIHQSQELVNLLMKVDLDDNIPPALYRVVAELLAWLYHIENELSATKMPPPPSTTIITR